MTDKDQQIHDNIVLPVSGSHVVHHMVVNLPFSFEFRKTQVEWVQTPARITGVWKRQDGTPGGSIDNLSNLIAEITKGGGRYLVPYSRSRLPEEWRDKLWWALNSEDVERVLSGYEPLLLVPSSGKTYAEHEEFKKHSQHEDASELLHDFLHVKPSEKEVLAFLNTWGRWNSGEFVELHEIVCFQQAVREAMSSTPEKWFKSDYSLPTLSRRSSEYPYFICVTDECEVAIRMALTIDLLNEKKFKICARPDCSQPFAASRSDKKFCCTNCGHTETVRKIRKAQTTKGAG